MHNTWPLVAFPPFEEPQSTHYDGKRARPSPTAHQCRSALGPTRSFMVIIPSSGGTPPFLTFLEGDCLFIHCFANHVAHHGYQIQLGLFNPRVECLALRPLPHLKSRLSWNVSHIHGHFTHEIESPWPLHSKHSHWWKRRSRSKFASHSAWGTNGVSMWMQDGCKHRHGFLRGIEWIMFHGCLDCFQKPPLGGRPNTKLGDHGTLNAHRCWFILF